MDNTTQIIINDADEWYDEYYTCVECGESFMSGREVANYCPNCGKKITHFKTAVIPVGTLACWLYLHPIDEWLLCDNRVVFIKDYPELANYFEEKYGMKNYYGGDGITTFATPLKIESNHYCSIAVKDIQHIAESDKRDTI